MKVDIKYRIVEKSQKVGTKNNKYYIVEKKKKFLFFKEYWEPCVESFEWYFTRVITFKTKEQAQNFIDRSVNPVIRKIL